MAISFKTTAMATWTCFVCMAFTSRWVLAAPFIETEENNSVRAYDSREMQNDEEGINLTLEYNFSPEDRARLKKALADYAKNTDPDHLLMEKKRKAMHDSISERFDGCNQDNDDTLDREEVTLCLPQIARHFNSVDMDGSDTISLEELELAHAKSMGRHKSLEAKVGTEDIQEIELQLRTKSKLKLDPSNKDSISKESINLKRRSG